MNKFLQTYLPGKLGWKERTDSTPDVVEFVKYSKLTVLNLAVTLQKSRKHSLGTEYAAANAPSRLTISNILRKDLNFIFKKLSVCPVELLSGSST